VCVEVAGNNLQLTVCVEVGVITDEDGRLLLTDRLTGVTDCATLVSVLVPL